MPKLRPLRKPEEIAAVPPDRPVAIDLSDDIVPASETPEVEKVEAQPEPRPEPIVEPEGDDEEESPLKKQLEAVEARERRLIEERTERDRRHAAELAHERGRVEQADYDTIVTALGREQADVDRAQADYEAATAAGDIKAQADANRRQQAALVKADRYEEAKIEIENRREQEKARAAAPAAQDFETRIASVPEPGKAWLRANPEYINDPVKNGDVVTAHDFVTRIERKQAWSPEYFAALETHLGLRRAPAAPIQTERRSPPVSAPVSRETPSLSSGRPQRRTVELSAEQRDAARISGVDDTTYARGVLELERRKKLGMYPDR